MQRFVNNPDFIVDDMLKGLVKANPEVRFSEENDHVISMKERKSWSDNRRRKRARTRIRRLSWRRNA